MDVMLFLCCSGEILSCTLWENYCIQFLSYLNERGDDGPMVIILTHARIKDAHGKYDILFTDLDTQQMSFVVVVLGIYRKLSSFSDQFLQGVKTID